MNSPAVVCQNILSYLLTCRNRLCHCLLYHGSGCIPLLFGIHEFSAVTSIITVFMHLFGHGEPYRGQIADRRPDLLIVFAILQGITGVYALFHPFIFKLLISIFGLILNKVHPSSFNLGILRIFLCFIFLFLPLSSISAIIPVLSRYFTKHIIQAGNRLSLVLSLLFSGMTTGLVIYGLLFDNPCRNASFADNFGPFMFSCIGSHHSVSFSR